MYSQVNFFKGKDDSFLAWISSVVKAEMIEEGQIIYKEGDKVNESKEYLK
jgi:hypothetical protein